MQLIRSTIIFAGHTWYQTRVVHDDGRSVMLDTDHELSDDEARTLALSALESAALNPPGQAPPVDPELAALEAELEGLLSE